MPVINKILKVLTLLLFIIAVFIYNIGCNIHETNDNQNTTYIGPEIQYSTYQLEATDIRLKCFQHPLYRLEYPSIFSLVDENLADIPHFSCDETEVEFTIQQTGIPYHSLEIIVKKPSHREYRDAVGALDFRLDEIIDSTDNFSVKKTKVRGTQAHYLEAHFIHFQETVLEYQVLSRSVFFDYTDFIWEISLFWCYRGPIPPEVEEYFNHVIETFEILD